MQSQTIGVIYMGYDTDCVRAEWIKTQLAARGHTFQAVECTPDTIVVAFNNLLKETSCVLVLLSSASMETLGLLYLQLKLGGYNHLIPVKTENCESAAILADIVMAKIFGCDTQTDQLQLDRALRACLGQREPDISGPAPPFPGRR